MEVIGLILFIVFMIATSGSKKKQQQAKNAVRVNEAQRRGAPVASGKAAMPPKPAAPVREAEAAARDFDDALEQMRQKLENAAPPAQGRSMLDDDECAGGSMPHGHAEGHSALEDDEDCAGGSMEHTHTEGVSRTAHARHMAAIDAGHEEEAPRTALLPDGVDAHALRRAVVMAEVLGRPRALRNRQ